MRSGIYWIASYPRSGNTWVRAFLTALLEGEVGDLTSAWRPEFGPQTPETVRRNELAQVRLAKSASGIVFCKTHSLRATANGVSTISPEATRGATYLVRDPRDVAASYAAFMGVSIDEAVRRINDINFGHLEPMGSWSLNVESWARRPDTTVVRYESLRADPAHWFSRIVRHAGIPADPERIAAAIDAATIDRLRERDRAAPINDGRETIRAGASGGWKTALSKDQAKAIERAHKPTMRRFGYI
jgi:hypothetical protein